jgi:hypothetical protein
LLVKISPVFTPIRAWSWSSGIASRISAAARSARSASFFVCDRDTEDRHYGVADELFDRAAVPLNDRLHPLEVIPEPDLEHLRIARIAERGRPRQVTEHDGYRLALLLGRRRVTVERRSATSAEGEAFRVCLAAAAADRHSSRLERLISSS